MVLFVDCYEGKLQLFYIHSRSLNERVLFLGGESFDNITAMTNARVNISLLIVCNDCNDSFI